MVQVTYIGINFGKRWVGLHFGFFRAIGPRSHRCHHTSTRPSSNRPPTNVTTSKALQQMAAVKPVRCAFLQM
jgi:hypothetical protein